MRKIELDKELNNRITEFEHLRSFETRADIEEWERQAVEKVDWEKLKIKTWIGRGPFAPISYLSVKAIKRKNVVVEVNGIDVLVPKETLIGSLGLGGNFHKRWRKAPWYVEMRLEHPLPVKERRS